LPRWLVDAHDTYLICQAAPGFEPDADEMSDFRLTVMARIHRLYEGLKEKRQAEMMQKMFGG
jgi:hypothetical protein